LYTIKNTLGSVFVVFALLFLFYFIFSVMGCYLFGTILTGFEID